MKIKSSSYVSNWNLAQQNVFCSSDKNKVVGDHNRKGCIQIAAEKRRSTHRIYTLRRVGPVETQMVILIVTDNKVTRIRLAWRIIFFQSLLSSCRFEKKKQKSELKSQWIAKGLLEQLKTRYRCKHCTEFKDDIVYDHRHNLSISHKK